MMLFSRAGLWGGHLRISATARNRHQHQLLHLQLPPSQLARDQAGTRRCLATSIPVLSRHSLAVDRRKRREDDQGLEEDEEDDEGEFKRLHPAERKINPNDKRLLSLIRKQIHHFDDPYQIGKHVAGLLEGKCLGEAILFVHKASRTKKIETAWNHIMEYLFKTDRPKAALKLYSEMKQRRQHPNAHTLTIIFSNLANSQHKELAAEQALKIYMSVLHNPRVGVNTIHLNAAVNACARALDIDAMFTILNTANENSRVPDTLTYTTIFNGMRHKISADRTSRLGRDLTEEQHLENAQIVINKCKIIWDEVVSRWRQGAVVLDEDLVCALCRVLIRGDSKDKGEILNVLEQTMALPNLRVPPKSKAPHLPELDASGEMIEDETADHSPGDVKLPPPPPPPVRREMAGIYATPDKNTLSLILQTLSYLKASSTGLKYWNLLLTEYGVIPDANNWHWLVVTLKRNHASGRMAELMGIIPREMMDRSTFRAAMEACMRDTNNPSVYGHASKIIDTMKAVLKTPDPEVMRGYISLALYKPTRESLVQGSGLGSFALMVMDALGRIWDGLEMALNALNFDDHSSPSEDKDAGKHLFDAHYNEKAELVSVARTMISAYDMVLATDRGSLNKLAETSARIRTRKLNWFIARLYPNSQQNGGREGRRRDEAVGTVSDVRFQPRFKSSRGRRGLGDRYLS